MVVDNMLDQKRIVCGKQSPLIKADGEATCYTVVAAKNQLAKKKYSGSKTKQTHNSRRLFVASGLHQRFELKICGK